jgi:hypothetical protein
MDPFRNYRHVSPAAGRHCPFGGCLVCFSQPILVRREFDELIHRSWSRAELDILTKAARSALL